MERNLTGTISKERALTGSINKGVGMGALPEAAGLSRFPSPAYTVSGAELIAVSQTIAQKTGVEAPVWPDGFAEAVEGIKEPETLYFTFDGRMYVENVVIPETVTALTANTYSNMPNLRSIYASEVTTITGHYVFGNANTPIEVLICPRLTVWPSAYWNCGGGLKEVQAGSVGYPVTSMKSSYGFRNNNRKDLVITIYVDAFKLSQVPADIMDYAPFEAINATIIYRNSTTGEVITE